MMCNYQNYHMYYNAQLYFRNSSKYNWNLTSNIFHRIPHKHLIIESDNFLNLKCNLFKLKPLIANLSVYKIQLQKNLKSKTVSYNSSIYLHHHIECIHSKALHSNYFSSKNQCILKYNQLIGQNNQCFFVDQSDNRNDYQSRIDLSLKKFDIPEQSNNVMQFSIILLVYSFLQSLLQNNNSHNVDMLQSQN